MTAMPIILLIISIALCGYLYRENTNLKKERDYYIEVDEENERLRKKLGEK